MKLIIALILLSIVFGLIEKLFGNPNVPNKKDWPDLKTDLIYWFVTPLFFKPFIGLTVKVLIFLLVVIIGRQDIKELAENGWGLIPSLPLSLQVFLMMIIGDFFQYWAHRFFHQGRLWKFHAVHHSPAVINFLSAVRVHPVNSILARFIQVMGLLALGFPVKALAIYLPTLIFYGLFLHTNVRFSFGPLRYIVATPNFHRWHHTSAEEGRDKNFSGIFVIWDQIFGTYYLPKENPMKFGITGANVPKDFLGQMTFPFKT